MAANEGWFSPFWFSTDYFPPVWFAPSGEEGLPPAELKPGGKRQPRIKTFPHWSPAPNLAPHKEGPQPVDDEDAAFICGII